MGARERERERVWVSDRERWSESKKRESWRSEGFLGRLKNLCRPLKTIGLMKYVKAHKETRRPLRSGGGEGQYTTSAEIS